MKGKSIAQRVETAFAAEPSRAYGEKYLDIVLQTWRDVQASLRRTTISVLVLIVVFLTLAGARRTQFSLGPLKLVDATTVLALIPPIVAYLFYELVVLLFASGRYAYLRNALIATLYPRLRDEGLHMPLAPGTTLLWGAEHWRGLRSAPEGRLAQFEMTVAAGVIIALPVSCAAFLVDAYLVIFARPEIGAFARWASLAICVLSAARAAATILDEWLDDW